MPPTEDAPPAPFRISVLHDPMRTLGRADRPTRERIAKAVEQMAIDPFAGDVRPLKGEPDAYRRRVGDWRILFRVDPATRTVTVYRVGPRGDVYGP